MNNNKGQSLVELIASIAIFSMVSLAIHSFFSFTINIYYQTLRQEELLYEHRLVKYACEQTIKKADFYTLDSSGNLIVYKNEENININEYIEDLSQALVNFKVENTDEVLTITYTIEVSNEKDDFEVKLMPPKNVD
ncbi:MAG: prepilin-type N-terminal cleavage/methylation domain-containing protein [Clostridia bacterium]